MSQVSGRNSEAASKPLSSHRLDSITPDSGTPQSGSPNSDTGYSPHSQPFAQRPMSLTNAGAAVRQSASTLPSPPPFTPGTDSQPAGGVSPVAFGTYSAGSCGSKSFMTDTPGVSSAWGASSSKPARQTESFAFNPPGASAASSPDVEQFNGALSNVTPQQPLPDILGQAIQNMASSADTDTRSERSEAASQSSTTSRSSRRSIGQSPGDLLRKAKVIFEKRVAVEGSSRIRHNRKNLLNTPMDKGIPLAATPQNTPMDVTEQRSEDQSSPRKSHSAGGKASAPGTPSSVTGPSKAPPGTSTPEDKKMVATKALSPPDSGVSVVSIGSICPTAGDVGRKLDFSGIAPEIVAAPAMLADGVDVTDVLAEAGSPLRSPMPLDKLIDSMQDTATKRDCHELLGKFLDQPVLEFDFQRTSASIDSPDLTDEFMGPVPAPKPPRSWLGRAGTVLMWSLGLLTICVVGLLAAEAAHANMLSTPGVVCTPENRLACLAARSAYFKQAGEDVHYPAWLQMVKTARFYIQDMWDATYHKQSPDSVTTADIIRDFVSRFRDEELQAITVTQARRTFAHLDAEFIPPIIAAKLAAAGDTATSQQSPADLVAVGSAPGELAEQQQYESAAEPEPPAGGQQDSSHVAEYEDAAAEGAAPVSAAEVTAQPAAAAPDSDRQEQPTPIDTAAVEAAADSVVHQADVPAAAGPASSSETATEPVPPEEQPPAAADEGHQQDATAESVSEAFTTPEQPQLQQPVPFEERMPASVGREQQEEHVQQQAAAPETAASVELVSAPAATESAAPKAPALGEQPTTAAEPAAAAEELEAVAEPSREQADMQHHKSTKALGLWSVLPYVGAALAASLVLAAGYLAWPLSQKGAQPDLGTAEGDDEVDGMENPDDAAAAAAAAEQQAATEAAEQDAAEAAARAEEVGEQGGGLLSDEELEFEPPVRVTNPRRLSAAAVLDAAISAGAATLDAVNCKVLKMKGSPLKSEEAVFTWAAAERKAAAEAAAAAGEQQQQMTPTAPGRRTAARTPRAAASGRTTSARSRSTAAAAAHDDGEEVQQSAPPSSGRPCRTVKGRKSVLPEVPEYDTVTDEPLLSDEEPAAAAPSGRAGRRRQSAPAADTEAAGTSGRGRRRSAAAAATATDAVMTPRTRRSSRLSQG